MTSKREIERRLDDITAPGFDGPDEIIITDEVVSTAWEPDGDVDDYDVEPFAQRRVWRDSRGEWHSEEVTDDVETQS